MQQPGPWQQPLGEHALAELILSLEACSQSSSQPVLNLGGHVIPLFSSLGQLQS